MPQSFTAQPLPSWALEEMVCLVCRRKGLAPTERGLVCSACDVAYPVAHRVPMLVRPDRFVDAAATIATHLGGLDPRDVESVFGTALRYRLHNSNLRTEFTNIVEHYDGLLQESRHEFTPRTDGFPFTLIAEYFDPNFAAGEESFRSFRIRNESNLTWASEGPKPFNLSYVLFHEDDPNAGIEGVRSAFPIPLRPGYELTVPMRIRLPSRPGRYRIKIMLVQEFNRWFDEHPIFESNLVAVGSAPRRTGMVEPPHAGYFDFEGDLSQCGVVLRRAVEMVAARRPAGTMLRVLEVACGNDPQTLRHFQPGTHVVACDIGFPQVQLGALQAAAAGRIAADDYVFLAADVYDLPFEPSSFDVVVICAALHHFANTVDALRQLRGLTRDGGAIVLLREPGKVFPEDETFIRELRNGFNEQQFELSEYDEMYRRAGLAARYEQLDYECSYKAIVEPA